MCQSEIPFLCSDAFAQETTGEEIIEPPPPPPDETDDAKEPELLPEAIDSLFSLPEIQKPLTPSISAEVDDFTGSAHLDYPIQAPPGRKGLTPKLSLKYSSSGPNTWVGVGWDISAGYIQRRGIRRGVPKYDDFVLPPLAPTDIFELSLNGGPPQELVYISSIDEYRHKIEGPLYRIKYHSSGNYWEVTDKTGVKMKFGSTQDSKIGTQRDLNPGPKDKTYRWHLDRIDDPNGNYMQLLYWRDQDASNTYQVYLQEIRYNGNTNVVPSFQPNLSITFTRETSDRLDKIYNYRGKFQMLTRKRLSSIEVWANTERVRRYQLQYTTNPVYQTRSLLTSITLYGSDNTNHLTPTNFTYMNQWSDLTEPYVWPNGSGCESGGGFHIRDNGGYGYSDMFALSGNAMPDRVVNYLSAPDCVASSKQWTLYRDTGDGFDEGTLWYNQGYLGLGNNLRVWNQTNRASRSEIIDLNGDGRPDRVVYNASCSNPPYYQNCPWSVHLNNGSGFSSSITSWANPSAWTKVKGNYIRDEAYVAAYTDGVSYDVIDMNGDGLPDRVVYDHVAPIDNTWNIYFNTGSGFTGGQYGEPWPNPSGINHIETWNYSTVPCVLATVIDMNGDGLPDRVVKNGSAWTVYFNTGNGFGSATTWPIQNGGDQGGNCIRRGDGYGNTLSDLIDLNGDGLPDRFAAGYGVRYNTGSGFGPLMAWPIMDSGLYTTSASDQYGTFAAVFDITGDGLPDQVISYVDIPESWHWWVYPHLGPLPDLLQKVENGIGGAIEFAYTPSTRYTNTYLPFIVQTVSSITTNDGNGVISATNYTYANGYFHATQTEREFRGFGYVGKTKPDQTTVETLFHQDDIKKGLPYYQITKDSLGNWYFSVYDTYNFTSPYPNVNFPYLERRDEYEYDGQPNNPRQSAILFTYDSYGNITRKQHLGDVSNSMDDKDENTEYFYNTTKWIVSLPTYKYIKDYAGSIKAKTKFTYDQEKGNLLTRKRLVNLTNDDDPQNPVDIYGYDANFGNLTSITDPRGYITTISYNDPDNLTYTYPYQITNPKNQTTILTYYSKFGKLKTSTDPNTNTTTYEYDVFGRLIKIKKPNDESSAYGTVTYAYENFDQGVGLQRIATLATEQSGTANHIWRETYFDGLGRTFKTRQEGPDGKVILTKTEYNLRGFVHRTSLPYFENLETPRWKTFDPYDPLGRVTLITYPDNTHVHMSYLKGVTSIIDQNGHKKEEERDVFKRLVKVREYTGQEPNFSLYAITNYTYSALDNLENVTDALGNQTVMVYDPLSRKISMTDPDMGFWEYEYDKNGNLIKQWDARRPKAQYPNNPIEFTHDELNRLTYKNYHDPVETNITYQYDMYDDQSTTNVIGRLAEATDASGTIVNYYDKLGRVTKTTKTVDSASYTVETTYDSLDRTTGIKYPNDTNWVTYTYDTGGNLSSITDHLTPVSTYSNYNALGQPGAIIYNNGVATTRQYYTTHNRLQSIATSYQSQQYQALSYLYDNKGNITRITDSIQSSRTQDFGYDALDRLTLAVSSSYGMITYDYSQIGNITYNSQVGSYLYQSAKPHAVTRAGTVDYSYDATGNMETGAGRAITNNRDNKPSSITMGGSTTSFVYDYQGQRVIKTSGGTPTHYIGKLYECTSGTCTKYIFGNVTRILLNPPAEAKDPQISLSSIDVAGSSQGPYGWLQGNMILSVSTKQTLERDSRVAMKRSSYTYYYHTDHLGGSNVVTGSGPTKEKEVLYYPYGATWVNIGGLELKHKFTGKEEDQETGLYYHGARYYDPGIGRFISPDAIIQDLSDPQTLNRYSYARNNPLKYVDPDGNAFATHHFVHEFIASMIETKGNIFDSLLNGWISATQLDMGYWATITEMHNMQAWNPNERPQTRQEARKANEDFVHEAKGTMEGRHGWFDGICHGIFTDDRMFQGPWTRGNASYRIAHGILEDVMCLPGAYKGAKGLAGLITELMEGFWGLFGPTTTNQTVPGTGDVCLPDDPDLENTDPSEDGW